MYVCVLKFVKCILYVVEIFGQLVEKYVILLEIGNESVVCYMYYKYMQY